MYTNYSKANYLKEYIYFDIYFEFLQTKCISIQRPLYSALKHIAAAPSDCIHYTVLLVKWEPKHSLRLVHNTLQPSETTT